MTIQQLFSLLLGAGILLIGAEIFLPGAILGLLGGAALLGAIITGFHAFPSIGPFIALAIVIGSGLVLWLWVRYFPRSRIGQRMMGNTNLAAAKSSADGIENLQGKEGVALSQLRPGGFALIEGKRIDVVTEGGMIEKNTRIQVVDVESNRVVVKKI
jgi:membrane-bound serine protease (ClpP class)